MTKSNLLVQQEEVRHGFYGMPEPFDPEIGQKEQYQAQLEYIANDLEIDPKTMIELNQVHSNKVRIVGAKWAVEPPKADGMVSNHAGLTLLIKTADCAPVLLVDPQAGVIGAAHAGWRGALAGVLQKTIMHMIFLGAKSNRIVAAIGPCIWQPSYEVGADFEETFLQKSSAYTQYFQQTGTQNLHFDLPAFCADQMDTSDIFASETLGLDTFDEKNKFFSYRRARKAGESGYGRNISVIHLPKTSK